MTTIGCDVYIYSVPRRAWLVPTQVWHWMILHGHFGAAAVAASIAEHSTIWNGIAHGGMVRAHRSYLHTYSYVAT